jgi:hypothetical protein
MESNISIQRASFPEFLQYVALIIYEGLYKWTVYVVILKIWGGKNSKVMVVKQNNKIIGAFCLTPIPLAKYKPYNYFKKEAQLKINELINKKYLHLCCFVVSRRFRNKGVGTFVFRDFFKDKKIWFTSSKRAVPFYLRNGAIIFYKSKYNIFTFN